MGPTWGNLGQLGANLGQLGATWGRLGANLGPTWANSGPTWGQLGATSGLRRGSFSLEGRMTKICTAPTRELDFLPPGGSKTGPDSVRNSFFRSSWAQEVTSKPFSRLLKRLPADFWPTWGQLGPNLRPRGWVRGESGGGRNRSWRHPGPKKPYGGHLGACLGPFGGSTWGRK